MHDKPNRSNHETRVALLMALALCSANAPALGAPLTTSSVSPLLLTGSTSADSEAYWLCTISTGVGTIDDHLIKLWADGKGISGSARVTWYDIDGELLLDLDDGAIRLSNFAFDDPGATPDRFDADTSAGERIACRYDGPTRLGPGVFLDPVDLGQPFYTGKGASADSWSCRYDGDRAGASPVSYAFYPSGLGESDGAPFEWYVDEREEDSLIVVGISSIREFRDISFPDGHGTGRFTARDDEYGLECVREG